MPRSLHIHMPFISDNGYLYQKFCKPLSIFTKYKTTVTPKINILIIKIMMMMIMIMIMILIMIILMTIKMFIFGVTVVLDTYKCMPIKKV